MVSKTLFCVVLLLPSLWLLAVSGIQEETHFKPNGSLLAGFGLSQNSFDAQHMASSTSGCGVQNDRKLESTATQASPTQGESRNGISYDGSLNRYDGTPSSVKLHLKHRLDGKPMEPKHMIVESTLRDSHRISAFNRRILERKNQNSVSRLRHYSRHLLHLKRKASSAARTGVPAPQPISDKEGDLSAFSAQLIGTLKSGVSLGSGEYFMDVFVGTPPKKFQLIVDTGSDLNWIQCVPCQDCFEQNGPFYDPRHSKSFQNITCHDPRCQLVTPPTPSKPCKAWNQSCPYFYWYGDSSNTTGDFSLETFTVNLTTTNLHGNKSSEFKRVENVMFGCGHWNRGLFHGAAGLLGLGRGPLSFSSQLQSFYGHFFSYCLVDRNSGPNVSSKLIFGEDKSLLHHPELNFTALLVGKEDPVATFYYVQIKSIVVGGEVLNIPKENWSVRKDGGGGAIVDSGTTLSYFLDPTYQIIKRAFVKRIKGYTLVQDFPVLEPCYNVSGVEEVDLPSFGIRFSDGAEWNFPVRNYFIWVNEDVLCLAILGNPRSDFSIIGNYQQQNFHVLYDMKRSRLGFAPTRCDDV